MSNFDYLKEEVLPWILIISSTVFLFFFTVIFAVIIIISAITNIIWPSYCYNTYNDSKFIYWIAPVCKVKYNWEYISEELYIKAFESNLNINIK